MDRSLPDSSIHGILQARVLEWGAIAFFLGLRPHHSKQEPTKQKLEMGKVMTSVKCVGFWEPEGWQVEKIETQNVALPEP